MNINFLMYFRILAFSIDPIKHVLVKINNEYEWKNCSNVENSPLFIIEWDLNKYSSGLHTISVSIYINR